MKTIYLWIQPTKTAFESHPLIKTVAALSGALLNNLFQPFQLQLYELIFMLVVFDTITGLFVGFKSKKISSKKWHRSLVKLTNYSILLIIGNATTSLIQVSWLADMVAMMIVTTETISIIENIAIVQPDLIPKPLLKALELLKNK